MNPRNKFWWFAGVSIGITALIIAILFIVFWRQLSPSEKTLLFSLFKNHFAYIFIALFLMLTGFVFAMDAMFHNYIIPVSKLAEEVAVIHSVNPSHRIRMEGSRDIGRLIRALNEGADNVEALRRNVSQKIQAAKSEAEEEKNLLASFMSELPEAVLICNADGRILFYNKRAREFLEANGGPSQTDGADGRYIGLGRSVFSVVDEHLILHALDEIAEKLERQEAGVAAYFVLVGKEGRLLRVEAVPILNKEDPRRVDGFILILYDITDRIETERQVDFLLQTLVRRFRSSLASIRSAIEAIIEYPRMEERQLDNFRKIIHQETVVLGDALDKTAEEYDRYAETHWPRVHMRVGDLFTTIQRKAKEKLDVVLKVKAPEATCWVKIDSYAMVLAVLYVLKRLKESTGGKKFECRFDRKERFVNVDLVWKGEPIPIETLRKWETDPLVLKAEGLGLSLREVMEHHDAQLWCPSCKEDRKRSALRLFLPLTQAPGAEISGGAGVVPEGRPEFYDFDLFNQPGQTPELDNQPLGSLTCTVFDTETTGLDPKGGDEIISIGAVRIVNGRLLTAEIFDQLVDPRRPLPYESVKVHGIQPEMLRGKPTIDKVLPMFHGFAEETVLVGHNAAFDMRMLQVKERRTGVRFINPVLDTLLLSAVVHPAQSDHSLEAIARRLGIRIKGRHTALGDAVSTGEIFLKLVPLLEKAGIRTLKAARQASEKTYYARLKY